MGRRIDWGDGPIPLARYRRQRRYPRDISYSADVRRIIAPFIVKRSPLERTDPVRRAATLIR
jgi:hypothetical protein